MGKYRQDRINDSVAEAASEIIREIKDPRVSDALITITAADVSADLKYAKIFYSCITGENEDLKKGLRSAAGFVRSRLAKSLNLRITPEIAFVYDKSVEHGIRIAEILNGIEKTWKNDEGNGEETTEIATPSEKE